jgi:tetratricopeptide (TPR) repeat protein
LKAGVACAGAITSAGIVASGGGVHEASGETHAQAEAEAGKAIIRAPKPGPAGNHFSRNRLKSSRPVAAACATAVPYSVLGSGEVEARMQGGLIRFQNMDHFTAAVDDETTYRGYTYKVAENGEAELRLSSGGWRKFPSTDELKTYVDVLTRDAPRTSDAPRMSNARLLALVIAIIVGVTIPLVSLAVWLSPTTPPTNTTAAARNDRNITDYNEAIRLDPNKAVAFGNRCAAYFNKGDADRAIADCNEAIRLDPKDAVAFGNRCAAYVIKGDVDRAIADCNEAIRLDPKSVVAFGNRCAAYLIKGDVDRAIADCNEAIRLDPKRALGFIRRGAAYARKGDAERAITDYNEAIRLDPKSAVAFCNRGKAKLKINQASGNEDIAKARQLDGSICR